MYRPATAATWASPWAMYAALRDDDPVHHVPRSGGRDYFVLSRHADVLAAAVDTATYSSAQGLTVEYDELATIGLADRRRRAAARGGRPRHRGRALKPLPTMVVAHYLGVPEVDRVRFDGWTQAIVGASSAVPCSCSTSVATSARCWSTSPISWARPSRSGSA